MKLIHLSQVILTIFSLLSSTAFGVDYIYVSNQGNNTIQRIDQFGNATVFTSSGINEPAGLAFDQSGNLYVANTGNNTIYKFDPSGVGTLFASSQLHTPIGLTFDNLGNLYAVNAEGSTITKFDPNGNGTLFASTNLDNPVGIACDTNNNIYVANQYLDTIIKFDPNGNGTVFATLSVSPYGMCFDNKDNLFISGWENSSIIKIDPSGNASVFATSTNLFLNNPIGLVFDRAGYLYEANYWNNSIGRFDSNGQGALFSTSILNKPGFIAIYSPKLPDGILTWWAAEGNGKDQVGTNDAMVPGGISYTNGKVGQAFYLDGSPNPILVPDAPELNFGLNQDFSIETWIQPRVAATSFGVMDIIDKRYAPDLTQAVGYEFFLTNGMLACQLDSASGGFVTTFGSAGNDLRDGKFHHVAMTVIRSATNGGNLYVDGTNVLTFDPTGQNGDLSNNQPLLIGSGPLAGFNANFTGIIDEASIYNRALTSNEIAKIFFAGSAGKDNHYIPPPRQATATAVWAGAFVVEVDVIDGGAGYTNTPLVRFFGGGGTNAQASVVVSNGVVVAINIVNPGSGYTNAPVVVIGPPYIPNPVLGISSISMLNFSNLIVGTNYLLQHFNSTSWINQSAIFKATNSVYTTMVSGSAIGSDYRLAQTPVPIQATAIAQVVNGFVVGGSVNNPGSGYFTPPNIAVIANKGSNAVATASISNGSVTGINIVNPGSGYVNPVTMQIDPPQATALSPAVTLGFTLISSNLAPYDNYQIQFKPDILGTWGNLNDGLFVPTNTASSRSIFLTNNAGFFKIQLMP